MTANERLIMTRYSFTVGQAGKLRSFAAAATTAGDAAGATVLADESERLFAEAHTIFLNEVTTVVAAHPAEVQAGYEAIVDGTSFPELKALIDEEKFKPVRVAVADAGTLPAALAAAVVDYGVLDDVWDAVVAAATWIADNAETIGDVIGWLGSLF